MHDQSFLHWVVTFIWGVLEVAAFIHVGHLQNLLFNEIHISHQISQVTIIIIYLRLMETHLICYEYDIRCYIPVLMNTNTHHFVNPANIEFNIFQSGFELSNVQIP